MGTPATAIEPRRSSSSLWSNCRPNIQRRINALLNLQADYFRLRVEFYRHLQDLQYTFSPKFEQILEQRRKLIEGTTNPLVDSTLGASEPRGLPDFWSTVLKNLNTLDYVVQPRDESCLRYLLDIRCLLHPVNAQSTGFTLEFHFSPSNPYFTQTVLTKQYLIRIELDDANPYRSYDGPEVDRCYGCPITWTADHNLTVRTRHRRVRHKATGQIRLVQVEESARSFFDFFSPPVVPADGPNDMLDDDQMRLEADIEFGLLLKQRVLPRAVLYYTGEALSVFHDDDDDELSSDTSQ